MSTTQPIITVQEDGNNVWATPLAKTMVPNAFGAVWCDQEAGTYWADPHACATLNIAPQGPLSDEAIEKQLAALAPGQDGAQCYHTFYNHAGHVCRTRMVPSAGHETVILVDDLEHITTRVFQLKASEREWRELFQHAPYGIYRATIEGRCVQANPTLVRLNGYGCESDMLDAMKGVVLLDYVDPDRREQFFAQLRTNGEVVDFVSEIFRHKTGERIWISETAWLIQDEEGAPRYMAGTLMDITERMKHFERVSASAETDALTGLANRASFYAELDRRISAGSDNGVTLYLLDCDRFKDINDIYGHARGDAVLQGISRRLRDSITGDAVLARLGGDEFAIVSSSISSRDDALALARLICDVLQEPIEVEGVSHKLGASVGISRFPDHALTLADLMRNADLALYAAKEEGRGCARLFDEELSSAKQRRHQIELDLRGAHRRDELELFYQPIVDARGVSTVGLEALIRWRNPARGLVNPNEFISVAEEGGLMIDFGDWAIQEACRHAMALPSHIKVAVNVSALQFRSSDLPRVVTNALAASGLDPSRLELEVTESMVLKNENATFRVLDQLRDIGVSVALDDFGTGYSTLSYLQRFAFNKVKIDRCFVHSIRTNAVNRAVTRAVLSIGRDLGIDVVAEGIETEAERESLLSEGCVLQQGYLYGQPQPFADAAALLALEALAGARSPRVPHASQDMIVKAS